MAPAIPCSPIDLLEKQASLVPPARFHLPHYPGVLAPGDRDPGLIVPAKPVEESTAADRASSAPPCAHRLRWATLLARVFSSDLSACAACGGRLRIVAALTDPDLSGGGRAAGDAPAEGPAASPVRVRSLTSSAIRSMRREPYGGVRPQRSLRPRIDPNPGRQATRMDSELGRRTGKRSSGSCLTLALRSAP